MPTNKFYANFFLGNQNQGVWTHPYSLSWSKGGGNLHSWGMAVSHVDPDQRAYGPQNSKIPGSPVQYFINPIGIQSIIFSAIELGASTVLTTDALQPMSTEAYLAPRPGSSSRLKFSVVQGMGFVTAEYIDLMPTIQSAVLFRSAVEVGQVRPGLFKYRLTLEDSKIWLLYVVSKNNASPQLKLVSSTQLQGVRGWSGMMQVCKNPSASNAESIYDSSAGSFATSGIIRASVTGNTGSYQLIWNTINVIPGQRLLTFALPHHIHSFDAPTARAVVNLRLHSTTKGIVTAVLGSSWTLVENNLPIRVGFAPWTSTHGSRSSLSATAIQIISQVANSELQQDINAQTNLDSMYFSGKAFSKFATLIYATHDLLYERGIALQALDHLKQAFSRFVNNHQTYPLVYDAKWNGVVSRGSYVTGDPNQDFGNSYYNDHHFHYSKLNHAL